MKPIHYIFLFLILAAGILIFFWSRRFEPNTWATNISNVGFSSSPRAVELTGDGVLDLVIGGGGPEFETTANGVTAIDGKNGSILWSVAARNQVVGSAVFQDITADGIPDVFIGGRSAVLYAIDGRSGSVIWEFMDYDESVNLIDDTSYLNFFNPQFIPDVDNDAIEDLLIAFGGFIKAKGHEKERPAGSLMIISGKSGQVLHQMHMPDGAETYMSPLVHDFEGDGELSVIFGSGGETIHGHLYRLELDDWLNGRLPDIEVLASGEGKGFVAPAVLVDVNQDQVLDIVVNPVNGRMLCLDGSNNELIWEVAVDSGYEVYIMPAPGNFSGNDRVPDFYSSLGYGPWPDSDFTLHILVDGKSGEIVLRDTLGLFQYASPVVYDLDEDGLDELILAINDRRKFKVGAANIPWYVSEVKTFDVQSGVFADLIELNLGSNLGSTPLLCDLDQDGWLDLVHCYMEDAQNFYSFKQGVVRRYELKIRVEEDIPWGTYMGKDFKGKVIPGK